MKSRNKLIIRWVFQYLTDRKEAKIAVFNKLFKERMKAVAFDYVEE